MDSYQQRGGSMGKFSSKKLVRTQMEMNLELNETTPFQEVIAPESNTNLEKALEIIAQKKAKHIEQLGLTEEELAQLLRN